MDNINIAADKQLVVKTIVDHSGKEIKFVIANDVCEWRVDTLYTKEPLTINWIRSFTPEDIFWDIGANIGIYTMFASVVMGTPTYAFEPHHLNYAILNENLSINKVDSISRAYCIGIGNRFKIGELSQGVTGIGTSAHTIGRRYTTSFFQGCVVMSIDRLVGLGLKPPTKLKIDIDGLEPLVIDGAKEILPNVHSVLIELNINRVDHNKVFDVMQSLGFTHNPNDSRITQFGKHAGNGEFIFYNTNVR